MRFGYGFSACQRFPGDDRSDAVVVRVIGGSPYDRLAMELLREVVEDLDPRFMRTDLDLSSPTKLGGSIDRSDHTEMEPDVSPRRRRPPPSRGGPSSVAGPRSLP